MNFIFSLHMMLFQIFIFSFTCCEKKSYTLPENFFSDESNIKGRFREQISSTITEPSRESRLRLKRYAPRFGSIDTKGSGQFSQHSYGHYGHQSNNYAQYGHDTYVSGPLGQNSMAWNQTANQHQARSQTFQPTALFGTEKVETQGLIRGFSSHQEQGARSDTRTEGRDSRQSSFRTAQDSGNNLNLPFGLRASNTYTSNVHSSGQAKDKEAHLQIPTSFHSPSGVQMGPIFGPDEVANYGSQNRAQSQVPLHHSTFSDTRKISGESTAGDLKRPYQPDQGKNAPISPPSIPIVYPSIPQDKDGEMSILEERKPGDLISSKRPENQPSTHPHLSYPHSQYVHPQVTRGRDFTRNFRDQVNGPHPEWKDFSPSFLNAGTSRPYINEHSYPFPSRPINSQTSIPSALVPSISGPASPSVSGISQGIPAVPEDARFIQQRYPEKNPATGYAEGSEFYDKTKLQGQLQRGLSRGDRPVNPGILPGSYYDNSLPIYGKVVDTDVNQAYPSTIISGALHPDNIASGYSGHIYPSSAQSGIPSSFLNAGTGQKPSGSADLPVPASTNELYSQRSQDNAQQRGSYGYGSDSVSSHNKIQTEIEGTAAEAASAGQYKGLGSQTQVQGGSRGNGSFSAQAQSGFTGGMVQSQVQGEKQSGLSGSNAVVERVGSAQSQVQIGQPSGSARSTAQGRFSQGMTQVQVHSNKDGGSAGAESQSSGLSSSHVNINFGEGQKRNGFHGTVSASVQGGHSSGQSQTQLQGEYDSGKKYMATAQGGFDNTQPFRDSRPFSQSTNFPSETFRSQTSLLPPASSFTVDRDKASNFSTPGRTYPMQDTGTQPNTFLKTNGVDQINHQNRRFSSGMKSFSSQLPPQTPTSLLKQRPIEPEQQVSNEGTADFSRTYHSLFTPTGDQTLISQTPNVRQQKDYIGTYGTPFAYPSFLPPAVQPHVIHPPVSHHSTKYVNKYDVPSANPSNLPSVSKIDSFRHFPNVEPSVSASHPGLHLSGTDEDIRQHTKRPSINQRPSISLSPMPPTLLGQIEHPTPQHPISEAVPQLMTTLPTDDKWTIPQTRPSLHEPAYRPLRNQLPFQIPQENVVPPVVGQPQISPGAMWPGIENQLSSQVPQQIITSAVFRQPQISPGVKNQLPSQVPQEIFPPAMVGGSTFSPGVRNKLRSQVPQESFTPAVAVQSQISPDVRSPLHEEQKQTETASTLRPEFVRSSTMSGASKPEAAVGGNCCDSARNLLKRCCDPPETQNNKPSSRCCSTRSRSRSDSDFGSTPPQTTNGQPCKVVKAICYIVYKPIGKARICKPVRTNGC